MERTEFTELLRQHQGLLYKVALAYCRNPSDRDDVIQEMAAQLWRARDRYDPRFRASTWIYRIALNVAISYHRRERRHVEGARPLDDERVAAAPDAIADDLRRLFAFIDELDPLDRALVLLYLDGHDHAATAEVLGISASNVGTRLGRIKDALRAAAAREDRNHGAA